MADNSKAMEALENLKDMVANFSTSDNYKAYLRQQAQFHHYSWRNTMLIGKARPDATMVKGFQAWISLGRCVKKGEKGIMILAPRPYKKEGKDATGATVVKQGMFFTGTYVWDISQTDPIEGHKNPFDASKIINIYEGLSDETGGDLYDTLLSHIEIECGPVSIYDDGAADGWYRPSTKEMAVKRGPQLKMLNTLIHEAAHHYAQAAIQKFGYDTNEVIVESVAYIVSNHFGLDTSKASVPYVNSWLKSDPKAFEKGMSEIQRLSHTLIEVMERQVAVPELIAA